MASSLAAFLSLVFCLSNVATAVTVIGHADILATFRLATWLRAVRVNRGVFCSHAARWATVLDCECADQPFTPLMLVQRPWVRLLNHSGTRPKPIVITSGRRLWWARVCSSSTAAAGGGGAPQKRTGRSRAKDGKNSGHSQLTEAAVVPTSGKADASSAAAEAGNPTSLSQILPVPARGQPDFPDAPFRLRPYQVEAIQSVVLKWKEEGANAQMVMLPTGCGKTVVFAGALSRHSVCSLCNRSLP